MIRVDLIHKRRRIATWNAAAETPRHDDRIKVDAVDYRVAVVRRLDANRVEVMLVDPIAFEPWVAP